MLSLAMRVEWSADFCIIDAPWLESPVSGKTFEEAYEKAIRARP